MFIGIDKDKYVVYEGDASWGARPVFPTPYLFGLQIGGTPEEALNLLKTETPTECHKLLFREDGFDPVSMVRRGRVYELNTIQAACRVCPASEADLDEARKNGGVVVKQLTVYQRCPLSSRVRSTQLFAVIGSGTAYSMWRIVTSDCTCFTEELVTMRPLYFLGALPDLSPSNMPEQWRTKVQETVGKVVDSLYRASADSIVDLCRHAASAALCACFLEDIPRLDKTDLGPLARKAEDGGRRLIADCARTLADLHSRLKPNIQMYHDCRAVCDRDAELAVQCLSCILADLGYTPGPCFDTLGAGKGRIVSR
jgi:hypothetical protein